MRRIIFLIWGLLVLMGGCEKKVEVDPQAARQMITHRNLGLAYLEENKLKEAAAEFQILVGIAPQEPLGYANLGLSYFVMGEYEQAEKWLQEALNLEPDHPDIVLLLAKVYEVTYREDQAIHILENALEKNPDHMRTLYQLAQYYFNKQDPKIRKKAEDCLTQVVNILPANVAARLQLVELLVQHGKPEQGLQHMETIRQTLPELPDGSLETFQRSLELMRGADMEQAFTPIRIFHNLLKPTSFYQAAITELKGMSGPITGRPIHRFSHDMSLKIRERAGIPDALNFTEVTIASGLEIIPTDDVADWSYDYPQIILAIGDYESDGDQDFFISQWRPGEQTSRQYLFVNDNGTFSDIADHAGISHTGRDLFALFADYDNDGYLDLLVTNTRANRLYHNTGEGTFRDVTADAGIQTTSKGRAAVFADMDLEGDLDLFIANSYQNQLYRNNSDGKFTEIAEEVGISDEDAISRDAGFGDFDDDGDIDLIVVNQDASNRYYDNLRQSYFRDITKNTGLATDGGSGAVAVGDYNNDGYLDLFVTDLTGGQHSLFRNLGDGTFERDARSDNAFESIKEITGLDAAFFDADNDGFLDLLVAGTSANATQESAGLWLFYNNGEDIYLDASSLLPGLMEAGSQVGVVDYDNDGDLDIFLVGFYNVHLLRNDGGNVNNYLVVRLAGLRTGSSKNNYFGIGAKLEVKAGTLYQMRVMSDPIAHFGLGNREGADVVRVVWSNGVPQNRFNPERNQTIVENQVLKGSCPWLFTWNGGEYEFVTDVLWASALGMPLGIIGEEITYAFANSTDEYFKIPGEKLQPKNRKYSLQFTNELWETPYVDHMKLLVVDHPDSVNILIDEKFTSPPFPPLHIYAVSDKQLPVSALDCRGNDVLKEISHQDGKYVSNLIPTRYQGIMESHDLTLDLGNLSQTDSVFLFLHCWVFPTDASINLNLAQSGAINSVPPFVQVIDEQGNWKTVIENMGSPKGKNKTLVVDLSDKFLTEDYRIRIRTNMQIYWDYIFYTTRGIHNLFRKVILEPVAADLHYRGFSEVTRETPYSPHIPDYQTVTTAPKWRDLTGLYTRYGNVSSLLLEPDSKYVIMNAGDELTIEFDATRVPGLPSSWSRDYIFYNDGWLKDGDLNTAHGQTVEPLPFHSMTAYPYGPEESYPKDEEHQQFLKKYLTRKVTTESFRKLIRNQSPDY
ncbi:MAG: VCBS repeat-containing protein [Fidelibacterota bacterium]|nr:MAG: VCBS repeat-containing protein [Candidatus Neomarinimicrobiota bacterium]